MGTRSADWTQIAPPSAIVRAPARRAARAAIRQVSQPASRFDLINQIESADSTALLACSLNRRATNNTEPKESGALIRGEFHFACRPLFRLRRHRRHSVVVALSRLTCTLTHTLGAMLEGPTDLGVARAKKRARSVPELSSRTKL